MRWGRPVFPQNRPRASLHLPVTYPRLKEKGNKLHERWQRPILDLNHSRVEVLVSLAYMTHRVDCTMYLLSQLFSSEAQFRSRKW